MTVNVPLNKYQGWICLIFHRFCPIHKHMYNSIHTECECSAYWLYGILPCHVLLLLHFCRPVCGIRHPSHLSWRPVGGDGSKQDCLVYEDTRLRWDRLVQQVTIWCAPVIRDSLRKCEDIIVYLYRKYSFTYCSDSKIPSSFFCSFCLFTVFFIITYTSTPCFLRIGIIIIKNSRIWHPMCILCFVFQFFSFFSVQLTKIPRNRNVLVCLNWYTMEIFIKNKKIFKM